MNKKLFVTLLVLSAVSLTGQLLLYPNLPAIMPLHWGITGQVDGFGPRSASLVLAALPLAGTLLMYCLPYLDPKGQNYSKHQKAHSVFSVALVGAMGGVSWALTLYTLGLRLPLSAIVVGLIGILLVVMGNYMPQLRPNFFMGMRTPWALANEMVWRKTNRFAGGMFVLAGVCFLFAALLRGTLPLWLAVILLVLVLVAPFVYSYLVYRKVKNKEEDNAEN